MHSKDLFQFIIPGIITIGFLLGYFLLTEKKRQRRDQRIARVTKRKIIGLAKNSDTLSLRKVKAGSLPFVGKALENITTMAPLRARLDRAGIDMAPDVYLAICGGIMLLVIFVTLVLHKPIILAILAALFMGIIFPYLYVGMRGKKRIKQFLTLFPDAIDFIVRGLRSGLPATESMNMVGIEMEEPIRSIFSSIGESVKLGVPVEKALMDTARKLKSTEFNFFVTSMILQRETGGNLSEILSNLSEVLRKRFMMRMKIKAMSSEAKASALIVGALPFAVTLVLSFVSPDYLEPLFTHPTGHFALGLAATMMSLGMGIMIKMTKFEI